MMGKEMTGQHKKKAEGYPAFLKLDPPIPERVQALHLFYGQHSQVQNPDTTSLALLTLLRQFVVHGHNRNLYRHLH